jgi:hypothetical protein
LVTGLGGSSCDHVGRAVAQAWRLTGIPLYGLPIAATVRFFIRPFGEPVSLQNYLRLWRGAGLRRWGSAVARARWPNQYHCPPQWAVALAQVS